MGALCCCCQGRNPGDREPCELIRRKPDENIDAKEMPRGVPIKVMSWNVQFCAGRDHLFFYEGGQAVQVPLADVEKTMKVVADIIGDLAPDIVLLQEIDRNSKRTHYQDELTGILKHLDAAGHYYPFVASTPYHQCCYVPAPSHEHMGKVDFHLVALSKYPIKSGVRHQLPLLSESWLMQQFNLRRAIMDVRIPVSGGGTFCALNTHLSAFAFNDGTPEKEIAVLNNHADGLESEDAPWVLGGDFNMLPPGDDPSRLGTINNDDHSRYYNPQTPITPLTDSRSSAMDLDAYKKDPAAYNTYVPLGTDISDRVLDWMFVGSKVTKLKYSVMNKHRHISVASDHVPLLLEIQL
eukprot:TRINITY_DN108305_c0_g1_i1.p1 TRINITY_DN108305_c0_g1~~TRINITY_DN108305_c0_g1_i1.p1  ORF type:complete len:351 (+),score=45.62 TRINITY_DN108305_c0_g1_i1:91-1143(+)